MYPLLMYYQYFHWYIIHTFTNVILRLLMTNMMMFINVFYYYYYYYYYYHFAPRRPAAKRGGQPPMRGVWGGAAPPVRNKVLLNYVRHQYVNAYQAWTHVTNMQANSKSNLRQMGGVIWNHSRVNRDETSTLSRQCVNRENRNHLRQARQRVTKRDDWNLLEWIEALEITLSCVSWQTLIN